MESASPQTPDSSSHAAPERRPPPAPAPEPSVSAWLDLAMAAVVVAHALLAPYSKVEESFNMQAMFDLGVSLDPTAHRFDHQDFPGVVPRTFLGALLLVVLGTPARWALSRGASPHTQLPLQAFYRLLLGLLVVGALAVYRRALATKFGVRTANIFALLFCFCQFHLPFYASRALPNTFSLVAVTIAQSLWLTSRPYAALALLTCSTVVLRCDLLVLLAPLATHMLLSGEVSFLRGITTGIEAGAAALCLTVAVDSHFWGRLVWPEGEVLLFNTAQGRSQDWGVSPWHWYLTSALPRVLHLLAPFALAALLGVRSPSAQRWTAWRGDVAKGKASGLASIVPLFLSHDATVLRYYTAPALAFVGLYSALGHKELRFLLPILPILLAAAAHGLDGLLCAAPRRRPSGEERTAGLFTQSVVVTAVRAACLALCVCASLLCLLPLAAAVHNYPGGRALAVFNALVLEAGGCAPVSVHLDVAACMTGVTRFGELRHAGVTYSKEENLDDPRLLAFDWRITDQPEDVHFETVVAVQGYKGLEGSWSFPFVRVALEDKLYIKKRRGQKK